MFKFIVIIHKLIYILEITEYKKELFLKSNQDQTCSKEINI